MRAFALTSLFALTLGAAACGSKAASLDEIEKLKTETCACKDKACADAMEKKADSMLTDATLQKHGEKGIGLAFDIAMCLEMAKNPIDLEGLGD
jgi:hypothetical protein